ncbi:tRNA guanosine-2'-O-methyltransferase TRM13-like protein, partial [Stegodyphus mimosarum]
MCLVEKVKTLYNETEFHINDSFTLHPILQAEMQNVDDGLCSFKHMKQQASLLALLENFNLLADGTCFLEFGAGKGQLMYWIIKCVPDSQKAAFILVDKSAQRHKSDNKFKGCDLLIRRIRIDIQHLHIGKIENIAEKLNKVVGVSKHLCGAATDLALNCLMATLEVEQNEEKLKHKALGMVMALCCHHRCTWSTYIGKEFMKEHGISERDFKIMCCIASWATCGLRKTDKSENPPNEDHCENLQDDQLLNRYIKLNLTHE